MWDAKCVQGRNEKGMEETFFLSCSEDPTIGVWNRDGTLIDSLGGLVSGAHNSMIYDI